MSKIVPGVYQSNYGKQFPGYESSNKKKTYKLDPNTAERQLGSSYETMKATGKPTDYPSYTGKRAVNGEVNGGF